MKKIISFIIAFNLFGLVWGQDTINNFYAEENDIIWQKVYETTLTYERLLDIVAESGLFVKTDIMENKLTGDLKSIKADYKGAGYSEMGTIIYISRNFITAFAIIDYKEGKYRVTLKKIVLEQQYDDAISRQGEKNFLNTFAIRKGTNEMKDAFKKSPSLILNYTFSKKFDFKVIPDNKNW